MSSRNGSYASRVDRMTLSKPTTPMERAKSAFSKEKAGPSKGPPSPNSARPAFTNNKVQTLARKAHKVRAEFAPSPERGPQPRGMGERGVNWQAHIKRANAMREQVDGPKRNVANLPPKLAEKAKKAARNIRTASPAIDKSQSPSR